MTNVLIPTDFSLQSLDMAAATIQHLPGKLNIVMFHAFDMPGSLIDAMHLGGFRNSNIITEELRVKCCQLKAENANIASIRFQFMYGNTVTVFRQFAEANAIDLIMYPDKNFGSVLPESVDPHRMFLRSGVKVIRDLTPRAIASAHTILSEKRAPTLIPAH